MKPILLGWGGVLRQGEGDKGQSWRYRHGLTVKGQVRESGFHPECKGNPEKFELCSDCPGCSWRMALRRAGREAEKQILAAIAVVQEGDDFGSD